MRYDGDVWDTLHWLNEQGEPIKIRIILEENKPNIVSEIYFVRDIHTYQAVFPNLTFYEGRRKFDWEPLLELPELPVEQPISSMRGSKIDDLWPWLYARLHNKESYKKYSNPYEDYTVLMDFIEIQ